MATASDWAYAGAAVADATPSPLQPSNWAYGTATVGAPPASVASDWAYRAAAVGDGSTQPSNWDYAAVTVVAPDTVRYWDGTKLWRARPCWTPDGTVIVTGAPTG